MSKDYDDKKRPLFEDESPFPSGRNKTHDSTNESYEESPSDDPDDD